MIKYSLVCLLFVLSSFAQANSLRSIPNFFNEYPATTIEDLVLGRTCLSLRPTKLGLACNPADLANSEVHQFRINTLVDNNLPKALAFTDDVKDHDYVGVTRRLLEQKNPVVTRDSASIWYQREWWAIMYTPMRAGFATYVENPAYPEVATQIYRQTDITGKMGFTADADPDLKFGIQGRFISRDYVYQNFDVLSALSDPRVIQISNEKALYLEPGITYGWKGAWDPTISATLTNLRVAGSGRRANTSPIVDIGYATRPDFLKKRLQTSFHFSSRDDVGNITRRFRWGGIYEFDNAIAVSFDMAAGEYAAGVSGHIDSVVLGLAYKYENLSPSEWTNTSVSSLIFQLGLVF